MSTLPVGLAAEIGIRPVGRSNAQSARLMIEPEFGGACRDRTDDPLLAKQVLSQLS